MAGHGVVSAAAIANDYDLPINDISLDPVPDQQDAAVHTLSASSASASAAPITVSYNDRIRPLLDAVDKLRNLKVVQEGIHLPTIVVVGDQSSGKSSVLESLSGISLPRGQGICTRVPLIMRLQNHPSHLPQLYLEFCGKVVHSDESHVAEAIAAATDEMAGSGTGISNTPLTLVVMKYGLPNLTLVDLPGITRVPVQGQPSDIYEQVSGMIMEYIKPEESIILNVLTATVDFSTCESIRMSQMVDRNGKRTLAVVTKCDMNPKGLLKKVTADDVKIGLGYVCVRNRVGEETYEEARVEEHRLFKTHPLLCEINESMVGIPVLARKLMQIQAAIVAKCLPGIVNKINEKLNANVSQLQVMPKKISSVTEATIAFMQLMGTAKQSLQKILLRGEFDEYPEDKGMHCTARLADMLETYSNNLRKCPESDFTKDFLLEELEILEETKVIGLPNFLPRAAFLSLLQRKIGRVSSMLMEFVSMVWDYVRAVLVRVLKQHTEQYPQLQNAIGRAAEGLMATTREMALGRAKEILEMEKRTDFTSDPVYIVNYNNLMQHRETFKGRLSDSYYRFEFHFDGKVVNVSAFQERKDLALQAFDLGCRMAAYWKIILIRMVDTAALHLQFMVQNLVNKEMEEKVMSDLVGARGGGLERMLQEDPDLGVKREKLERSINLLKESREVLAKIMDRIDTEVN